MKTMPQVTTLFNWSVRRHSIGNGMEINTIRLKIETLQPDTCNPKGRFEMLQYKVDALQRALTEAQNQLYKV